MSNTVITDLAEYAVVIAVPVTKRDRTERSNLVFSAGR